MENWTIRKQITALSGLAIAFLLVVAAVTAAALILLNISFGSFNDATQRTERLNLILEDLLEANVAVTAFEHTADPQHVQTAQNEIDDLLSEATKVDDVTAASGEFTDLMADVTAQTAQYVAHFSTLQTIQAQKIGKFAELSTAGFEVSETIGALAERAGIDGQLAGLKHVKSVSHDLVLARLYLERFIRTQSVTDLDKLNELRATAEKAFEKSSKLLRGDMFADLIEEARNDMAIFFKASDQVLLSLSERNKSASALVVAAGRMGRLVEDAVDAASLQQSEIWQENQRNAVVLAGILAAAIGFALVMLSLASRRFASQIRQAIETTVNDMKTLASGEIDFDIAGTELETEIGEMARSLEVFRTNAVSARQLQANLRQKELDDETLRLQQAEKEQQADVKHQEETECDRLALMQELASGLGGVVNAAANGDFTQRIDRHFGQVDLDGIVEAVNSMVESVETSIGETARVLSSVAGGDLTDRMTGKHRGLFFDLQKAIDETASTLADVISEIVQQCSEIGASSHQMERQADDLSSRAETQAAAIEETSVAINELSASVRSGADSARQSSAIAKTATDRVNEAGHIVGESVSAMTDIKGASEKIKDIVAVMDGIAYQTNLLALNASVEAARAGDAGKGFAVVATEVRALAQRSGEASKDIKRLIKETVSQVERGVTLVERTGDILKDVVEGVGAMSETMDELAHRAQEQAAGVGEVASAIHQMDAITQKNAALADDSHEAARALGGKMNVMQGMVGRFKVDGNDRSSSMGIAAE